jgi:restriction system protein
MAKDKYEKGAQFVRYFGPLLDALRELGGSGKPDEVVDRIASDLQLSDALQNELLPSGGQRYRNQVAWSRFYLVQEGLVDASKRGVWSLTDRGSTTTLSLAQSQEIFRKWVQVFQQRRVGLAVPESEPILEQPVKETSVLEKGYRTQLLELIYSLPDSGFEQLCQAILREAGFSEVVVTGRPGDQGIDGHGMLQINPLVSLRVLFQCKRYKGSVSAPQVRNFRGAMAGRADQGIIITTGTLTAEARREGSRDGVPPIELIDGEKLVDLLESLELGLVPVKSFELDGAFFNKFRGKSK